MGSKALKKVAGLALPVVGNAIAPGVGAAIGGALGGAVQGEGLKGIGLGAVKGYAGNAIGNSIASTIGTSLGKVGGASIGSLTSKNAMGPFSFGDLGGTAANSIGNSIANTTVSSALGKFAGNSIADNLVSSLSGVDQPQNVEVGQPVPEPQGPAPFEPKQEAQLTLPNSLSGLSSLDPNQQSTNIATQGVYGGGAGPQEQDYFENLINRRLVDESGQVDSDLSDINPIESSYLSQLGFGGYNTPSSLLEALYGRNKAQVPA